MKVLVTGATGFVGRHVVPELLARGHEVTTAARDEAKAASMPWIESVRHISTDIHRASEPQDLLGGADALVHLAWPGLPNYLDPVHLDVTFPADYRFLKSMIASGISQVLVTGTCLEYGLQEGCLAEELPAQPTTPYGLAKDTLHRFLEAHQQQHVFALKWARLFYMHGPGQNPGSLLAQLDRAIDRGDAVFRMSLGEQLRDYLPVQTVAAILVDLLEEPVWQGVVNVCSGRPISVRRLVEEHVASRGARLELDLGYYSRPEYEPLAFWGDARKLTSLSTVAASAGRPCS